MNASGRPVVAACQAWVRLREVAAVLLAALALTAVAILNGFPLVEFDSSRYIHSAFTLEVAVDRPVFYSLFIRLSRLVAPTLWATVLLQSLLTALVIHSFLRARVAPRAAGAWTLAVTLALTLLTSVAWYSGYIMADLFTGLMFLAVVTLLVDPHAGWRAAGGDCLRCHCPQLQPGDLAGLPGRRRMSWAPPPADAAARLRRRLSRPGRGVDRDPAGERQLGCRVPRVA